MNLAQLIDPERVQRGLDKERQEVKPAPCPPLGMVLHDADTRVGETTPPPRRALQLCVECNDIVTELSALCGREDCPQASAAAAERLAKVLADPRLVPATNELLRDSAAETEKLLIASMPPKKISLARRILQVLADAPHALRVREITKLLGKHAPRNPNTVSAALCALYERQRMVERDGNYGARRNDFFLYSITDAGRKKLGGQ